MDRDDNRIAFFLSSILLSTILIYLPTLNAQLVNWDDNSHVILNQATKGISLANLKLAFTQTIQLIYIPLTTVTWMIERHFFGLNPTVFHLTNIIFHALNACGIMWLARRMGLNPVGALIAALLFAWHPMKVESVAWVTERKDVLCGFFYIATLITWTWYRQYRTVRSYFFALIFAAAALLSKPMAISLPLILLLCDWHLDGKVIRRHIIEKIPFGLLAAGIGWITYQHHARNVINDVGHNVLVFAYTAIFYPIKFLAPVDLTLLYTLPKPITWHNPIYVTSVVLMIIMGISLWVMRRRHWYIFAVLFWIGTMFFLWRYDGTHDINIVADRFIYIPSIGICLSVGYWYERAQGFKQWCAWAILAALALASSKQVTYWQDSNTLYTYAIQVNPQSTIALNNRAEAWFKAELFDLAIADYNQILSIKPGDADTYMNRGLTYHAAKRYAQAIEDYTRVLAIYPWYDRAYNQRGVAYLKLKRWDEALKDFNRTLQLTPDFTSAYINRGLVFQQLNQYQQAIEQYSKALAIDPSSITAYNNRGVLLIKQGLIEKAKHDFQQVLALDPTNEDALFNLELAKRLPRN